MKIQKQLNELIRKSGLTAKEISVKTGISQAQLSDYRHGVEPTEEKQKMLESFFSCKFNDPEKAKESKFGVDEAAKLLNMGSNSLRIALKKQLFNPQIGIAIPHDGGRYTYEIWPERVKKYINGEIW